MKDVGDDYDSIEFDFPPVELSEKNQINPLCCENKKYQDILISNWRNNNSDTCNYFNHCFNKKTNKSKDPIELSEYGGEITLKYSLK